jgi:hypothetical protein
MAESAAFTELNAATYKARGPVHLFLLNDSMLVAVQRRRQMGSKVKLVADKCFTLNEIVVVDLKDGGELVNAIKIKKSKEIFIFCAERAEDKKALLAAFKKVAEEMISKKRKQSIWEAETRRDVRRSAALTVSSESPRRPERTWRFAITERRVAGVLRPHQALWAGQDVHEQGPVLDRRRVGRACGAHCDAGARGSGGDGRER